MIGCGSGGVGEGIQGGFRGCMGCGVPGGVGVLACGFTTLLVDISDTMLGCFRIGCAI